MEPDSTGQIIAIIVLIGLSCFFSMSETALTTIGKLKVRAMVDTNVKGAKRLSHLKENPDKFLTAILIANNFVNILATALATNYAAGLTNSNFMIIATGVMTFTILVFGEITPKTIAQHNADKISLAVAGPIYALQFIITPLIWFFNLTTFVLLSLLGVSVSKRERLVTEDDIKTMIDVGHEEGVLELDEHQMISNIVDFGDYEAKSVMTPRTKIVAADVNSSYDEIVSIFKEERFSRLPIYEENIDNIIGVLFVKDLVFTEQTPENFDIRALLREAQFTYESKSTVELFALMKSMRCSMTVVLDEYGGTSGIVTMEDLIEEIVGEITDEDDDDDVKHVNDDEYIIEGSMRIDEVNEMLGTSFESRNFDSIGGYVIEALGRFPEQGEELLSEGIAFMIEEIDKNRIEKIRLTRKEPAAETVAEG